MKFPVLSGCAKVRFFSISGYTAGQFCPTRAAQFVNTATNNPQSFLSIWVLRLLRIPLLLVHVLIGMPLTIVTFNKLGRGILIRGRSLDVVMLNWWGRTTCRIVGVRVIAVVVIAPEPVLVVANHMSWLDAPVMHSIGRMGFVAKAEIRRWPLLGWMAMVGAMDIRCIS